ncbi:hypothetical protein AO388_25750 [Pseudomonas sp. ICMP 10191]|nr:hypothetical protein AO388_25750 [Pseudomonas sp. ICMP 10191]
MGAHVVINYAGVHPPQRIGPVGASLLANRPVQPKQGVWPIAFASKLAPTKSVYNARRFSVGAHVIINYAGVHPT